MRPRDVVVVALLLAAALVPAYWLATHNQPPPLPVDVAPVTPIPTSTTVPPVEV